MLSMASALNSAIEAELTFFMLSVRVASPNSLLAGN